jgi:hypothetical protein
MTVGEAKAVARRWVVEEASRLPGFHGAYFAGSTAWLPDDALHSATSDLDLNVVFTAPPEPSRRGKLLYHGLLLDVTPLALELVRTPEAALGHYHLAGGFRRRGIILDPSGHLSALQAAVSREFARRRWVRARCAHARGRILEQLAALNPAAPFHEQVIGWLFPTGVTAHVVLVAGLRNPTVRRRYVAARELLEEYGCLDLYDALLALLGCAHISRTRVEQHLAALVPLFDAASALIKTPFSFASDISAAARPIAIDGSRELIERGLHREALFWIAVTASRCRQVLAADAPPGLQQAFDPGYRRLLSDLGIASFTDLQRRAEDVRALLPRIWDVAEAIMAAHPEIRDGP